MIGTNSMKHHYLKKDIFIYERDPEEFFSAPGLTWQAALKRIKVKLDLLTDINMF